MLSGPNDESPANVEAAVSFTLSFFFFSFPVLLLNAESFLLGTVCIIMQKEWRENREEFKKKVSRCVRRSQEMM